MHTYNSTCGLTFKEAPIQAFGDAPVAELQRMQAEDYLCLLLAQRDYQKASAEVQRLLELKSLRWELVIKQALRHEIFPLLYDNLTRLGLAKIPEETRATLEGLFRANAIRNELLAQELTTILAAFHQAGIAALPLKGLPLAERLYQDIHLRVCADMDLLVPSGQLLDAFALLEKNGYTAGFPRSFLTRQIMRNSFEYPMWRSAGKIRYLLELHSALLWEYERESPGLRDFWSETRLHTFRGVPAYCPSPEWEFLFLTIHAARHDWQFLKWLVDLHEFSRSQPIRWAVVAEKTRFLGWESPVQTTRDICATLFGASFPNLFPTRRHPPRPPVFPHPPLTPSPLRNTLLSIRLERNSSAKIRLFLRRVFVPTPREGIRWHFSPPWQFLYYLLRPLRLLVEATRRLLSKHNSSLSRRRARKLRHDSLRQSVWRSEG